MKLVGVLWDDAHGGEDSTLGQMPTIHRPWPVTTYGLLLMDDSVGISLAMEVVGEEDWRGVTFIPRSLIKEVWTVSKNPSQRTKRNRTFNA